MKGDDFTLVGGLVYDGSRNPPRRANVSVKRDRIARIGDQAPDWTSIDVSGLVVAPGFIDIHSHADWVAALPNAIDLLAPIVRQGITTTVGGNCGSSPAPLVKAGDGSQLERVVGGALTGPLLDWTWHSLSDFGERAELRGLPVNLAMFVGHSTLRVQTISDAERPATPSEIVRMGALAASAIEHGAVGLSYGFEYVGGRRAGTDEAVAIAAAMPRGVVAMHTRGLSSLYSRGMVEGVEIGERSHRPVQLSHVNPLGREHRSAADTLPDLLRGARARGVEVNADAVVYTVWKNGLLDLFPPPVAESYGLDGVRALAATVDGRKRLHAMVHDCVPSWPSWAAGAQTKNPLVDTGWDDLVLCETADARFEASVGRSIAAIGMECGIDPFEILCDLVSSDPATTFLNAWVSGDMVNDEPMEGLIRIDGVMPSTDAIPTRLGHGQIRFDTPHAYGSMPRFLGRFSRDLGLLSLGEAIWRMTRLPARWLGLQGRGELSEGSYADIVVFDPATVSDAGTLTRPEPPVGIEWVFVNGTAVVRKGVPALAAAGRYVRRS